MARTPRTTLCVNDLVELTTFPGGHKPYAYIQRFADNGTRAVVTTRDRIATGSVDVPAGAEFLIPVSDLHLINPDAFVTLAWR